MNNGSFYKDSGGYANYTQKRKAKRNRPKNDGRSSAIVLIIIVIILLAIST